VGEKPKNFGFSQLPNCPSLGPCNRIAACWEEGRQCSPAPGPLGRAGDLCALPYCIRRLSSAASRVFTPGNPCAGPMDSSAEEGSRAVSASTHDRAHWSQVGKGQTFETVFVESDTHILHLQKVPVGEKVYLQRDQSHGRTISNHTGWVFEAKHDAGDSRCHLSCLLWSLFVPCYQRSLPGAYTSALFRARLRPLTCLCAGQGSECKKGCKDKV